MSPRHLLHFRCLPGDLYVCNHGDARGVTGSSLRSPVARGGCRNSSWAQAEVIKTRLHRRHHRRRRLHQFLIRTPYRTAKMHLVFWQPHRCGFRVEPAYRKERSIANETHTSVLGCHVRRLVPLMVTTTMQKVHQPPATFGGRLDLLNRRSNASVLCLTGWLFFLFGRSSSNQYNSYELSALSVSRGDSRTNSLLTTAGKFVHIICAHNARFRFFADVS